MKYLLLIISVGFGFTLQNDQLIELRRNYFLAAEEGEKLDDFRQLLDQSTQLDENIIKGYEAMYYFLNSRESWNPMEKWNSFQKGKKLMDEAISEDESLVELRFLRLTIQHSVPSFLEYNDSLEMDKIFVREKLSEIEDSDLRERINKFFTDVGYN